MSDQIEIKMSEKQDRNGDDYLIGSVEFPASVKLNEVTFLVYYPDRDGATGTLVVRKRKRPSHNGKFERVDRPKR
jgi:hypothetical protein